MESGVLLNPGLNFFNLKKAVCRNKWCCRGGQSIGTRTNASPTMLFGQMIFDDSKTRPMEEITVRKELSNLTQGKLSPQELFAKIRELEEKAAIKLSPTELFYHFHKRSAKGYVCQNHGIRDNRF